MKNEGTTGVIFASGEGSRLAQLSQQLGVPKHLFPLGNSSIVERIVAELSKRCQQIVCITNAEHCAKFQQVFANSPYTVEVVAKEGQGFHGDFMTAFHKAKYDHIVLTVGDLIFDDGVLDKFVEMAQKKRSKALLTFDSERLQPLAFPPLLDFRIVATSAPRDVLREIADLDPESFWSVTARFCKFFARNRVALRFIPTLFNINTPENYLMAKEFFSHK